jgi:hypothetical protein
MNRIEASHSFPDEKGGVPMKRICNALRKGGVASAGRALIDRVGDFWHERTLGITTRGLIPIEALIDESTGCHDYFPTSYATFRQAMERVEFRADLDVFIDYGAGSGRVLAMAAGHPFRRIIGVEISRELSESARMNLRLCRMRLRCKDIDVWTGDSRDFPVPPDASVVFLYNPFRQCILRRVLANLRASLDSHPRPLRIIYNNPVHFFEIASDYPWLVESSRFAREHICAIYESI